MSDINVDNLHYVLAVSLNCQTQNEVVDDVVKARLRRTRYLGTSIWRAPCSNAGVEMYERLTERSLNRDDFLNHLESLV